LLRQELLIIGSILQNSIKIFYTTIYSQMTTKDSCTQNNLSSFALNDVLWEDENESIIEDDVDLFKPIWFCENICSTLSCAAVVRSIGKPIGHVRRF